MRFGGYNYTPATKEETAKDMSLANLQYELTKEHTQEESIVLIKEGMSRCLGMLETITEIMERRFK